MKALALVAILIATGASAPAAIVTVNGQEIPRAAFDAKLEQSPGAGAVLVQVVEAVLLDQYVASTHIVITDDDINAKEDAAKAGLQGMSWDDALKSRGLTEADVRTVFREEAILDRALASQLPTPTPGTIQSPTDTQTQRQQQEQPLIAPFMQKLETEAHLVINDPQYAAVLPGIATSGTPRTDGAPMTANGAPVDRTRFDAALESGTPARAMLQDMVQSLLLDQYAKANSITVTDAQVDKLYNNLKAVYPGDKWTALLQAQGLTDDGVRALFHEQIIVDAALQSHVHVTPAMVGQYFTANIAQFETGDQARARHILVADLATANKIEALLKHGGNFAALAKQYSMDPGSKDKGGELGWFGRGVMVAPFNDAVFSAKVGAISAPVKSAFGYHIIQVEARKYGPKPSLAANQDHIRAMLVQQQEKPFVQPFLQGLWQKATIVTTDPHFTNLSP